jgi:hypothetical protein
MKTIKSLRDIYATHESLVSDKWDIYLSEYNRLFQSLREEPIQLLEIGVQNGGSLEIWSEFFPNARLIAGCDINDDCRKLRYPDTRVNVVVGDINSDEARQKIESLSAEFDIIIDDGSHTSSDIITSFFIYFSRLKTSGYYVIEDLHCSYWEKFEGGLFNSESSMSFLKDLADVINHEHWGLDISKVQLLKRFGISPSPENEEILSEIHSVEFVNSMCILTRRPKEKNILGVRHIVGTQEIVSQNKFADGTYSAPQIQMARTVEPTQDQLADKDQYIKTLRLRITELESILQKIDGCKS